MKTMGFPTPHWIAGLARLPKPWTVFLALILAALVGLLDYATGYDFHVTAFYLVPICWATWAAGRTAGLFLATACTAFFGAANLLAGHTYAHPMLAYWNALMLLAMFVVTVLTLTAFQEAYRAAREGESRFQALFAQSLVGVAQVRTATGRFARVNPRFHVMFGYTAEELLGMNIQDLTHPDDLGASLEHLRCLPAGDVRDPSLERRYVHKDGSVVWVSLTRLPLWSEGASPDFHLELVEDITARRQLEEKLSQARKMEAIGHLAGGMAHEFNNILAALMMNLSLVKMFNKEDTTRELLREMEALSQKAAGLIKQLLAFCRKSVMKLEPLDLAATVARQCALFDQLLGRGINVAFSRADHLSWVNADKTMMEQVLLNLCLNARDAMKQGGRLQLHLAEVEVGAEQAKAHEEAQPGEYLCLCVTDTGSGMDDQTMKRLFEPFFTTKEVGQGTGLGLATVRGIVQQHHGWVEAQSSLGHGSTFRVYLPAVPQPLASRHETSAPKGGTMLVAEPHR